MWTSAHFAVGMMGGAAIASSMLLMRNFRRFWPGVQPLAMTLGGLWACVPDIPRVWREDFPSLPFAAALGAKDFEHWLHSIGNVFFFHQWMDHRRGETGQEMALHGLIAMIALYCFAAFVLTLKAYWRHRWTEKLLMLPPGPPALPVSDTIGQPASLTMRLRGDRQAKLTTSLEETYAQDIP